jgi:L-ascorbate metabolism protein UlaG (beta-lactamase superfamily)
MNLIPAIKKDEELLAEMDELLNDEKKFYLWWLGLSGFLLQCHSQRLLIDPYLSDSLTKKYANTNKPHVRMSERVIAPELLKNICIVTSSHNHTDHLDAETLLPIIRNNPNIDLLIPEANRKFVAERLECESGFPVGLNAGQSVVIGDFTFHGIPAKHNEIEKDEQGNCKFMGYVIETDAFKIYHSGDTLWFDGMVDLLKRFQVDVALLPINGDDPKRGVAGNLNCKEAASLAKAINAKCVIPCHYDMFTFNTADVMEFAHEAKQVEQPFTILRPGEKFEKVIPAKLTT